jgi:transposase
MKKWEFFLGVDVSKLTLDIHCHELNMHIKIVNGTTGFRAFLKWCKDAKIDLKRCILTMEYTGGYEFKLMQFCESKSIQYCRIPGLAIKQSLGIVRGKNDKADAKRIAQYAYEKDYLIAPSNPMNTTILELRQYLSFRKRLVREAAGYKATLKERKVMYGIRKDDILSKIMSKKITENAKLVKTLEGRMHRLIQTDQQILMNYKILTSIRGIGEVNALMTIAFTENFTSFKSARSYAVYVGVVPYENTSGTSLKGPKKISQLANKELKQELNQAARVAIQWNKELKKYAENKLKQKPYKLVLNNVKFKLILRMFSLVKRGEFYVENYRVAA